jgi:peptide/nickel transport system permease protein
VLLSIGILIVFVSLFLAAVGPYIAPYDPETPTGDVSVPPPHIRDVPGLIAGTVKGSLERPAHWFGTDSAGLDIFSRVLAAPRTDVVIALAATALSLLAGTFLGLLAGFYRGWASGALMRVSDVVQSFPVFILAMMLVALAGRSAFNIIVTLAFLYIPIYIRLTRAQVLAQRERAFVEAARSTGNREMIIAVRHVLGNSLAPALIQASVTIGWAILLTAGLSFVGAGVRPPTPEWGGMIATGAPTLILGEWWPSIFPGVAISITVVGYAIIGNLLEEKYGE